MKIHTEIKGRGDPVVFLHGYGGSTRTWKKQVKRFSEKYKVVLVDLRGHGESDKPHKYVYTIDKMVGDVHKIVKKLKKKPVIVGLSMGAILGLVYAAKHPRSVKGVVPVSPVVRSDDDLIADFVERAFTELEATLFKKVFKKTKKINPDKTLADVSAEDREMLSNEVLKAGLEARIQMLWEFKRLDIREYLPKVKTPTLIVYGDEDWVPREQSDMINDAVEDSRLMILKAGHMMPLEKPKVFNNVLEAFFEEVFSK